jgi:hypothetical protein
MPSQTAASDAQPQQRPVGPGGMIDWNLLVCSTPAFPRTEEPPMTITLQDIPRLIFECLRALDAAATNRSYYKGVEYPTGLRQYALHVNPHRHPDDTPKQGPYEEAMTNGLAACLENKGLQGHTFPPTAMARKATFSSPCQTARHCGSR